jgi:hypothetical protein
VTEITTVGADLAKRLIARVIARVIAAQLSMQAEGFLALRARFDVAEES